MALEHDSRALFCACAQGEGSLSIVVGAAQVIAALGAYQLAAMPMQAAAACGTDLAMVVYHRGSFGPAG